MAMRPDLAMLLKEKIKSNRNFEAKSLIKANVNSDSYPELIHACVFYGNIELLEYMGQIGGSTTKIPTKISCYDKMAENEYDFQYKAAPYIILAAAKGKTYALV